jgi:5'-3' exonuclease
VYCAYLHQALIDVTRPTGVVFVAVDGVAPRAKMAQQRTRRFLSAYVQSIQDAVGGWHGLVSIKKRSSAS